MTENGGRIWAHDLGELCGGPAGRKVLADRCFLTMSLSGASASAAAKQRQATRSSGELTRARSLMRRVPGKPRGYTLEIIQVFCRFHRFRLRFCPRPALRLRGNSRVARMLNGAPNTLWFPCKFPETKSAGDPLVSFLVSGNMGTQANPPSLPTPTWNKGGNQKGNQSVPSTLSSRKFPFLLHSGNSRVSPDA